MVDPCSKSYHLDKLPRLHLDADGKARRGKREEKFRPGLEVNSALVQAWDGREFEPALLGKINRFAQNTRRLLGSMEPHRVFGIDEVDS